MPTITHKQEAPPSLVGAMGRGRAACAIIALCFLLLTPLSALACGGFYTGDTPIYQNTERLIFAVAPGSTTLYEQISYSGDPKNFAWVLPVPSVPKLETTSIDLFRNLDQATAPRFYGPTPPPCGLAPLGGRGVGSGAPAGGSSVQVYGSGQVGPFAYDVIGSSDPNAAKQWLVSHHYQVNDTLQTTIAPYTQAHMLFLAMRLQPQAGVQDITPIKVTFATTQNQVMIAIRMAATASSAHMGLLVWIFGSSRFVPQNYQSVQVSDKQLSVTPSAGANYQDLVDKGISSASGHGFVTEFAQPTTSIYTGSSNTLSELRQHYSYVTRLYTRISPENMTLDPIFVAQSGLSNVSNIHDLSDHPAPTNCDAFNLFLGSLGQAVYPLSCLGLLLVGVLIVVGFVLVRRRVSKR